MVNVVEEICQSWTKNWIVFYVKFVLSTKNYGHTCNNDDYETTKKMLSCCLQTT